ncbi:MAG: hypothetical protein ACRDIL_11980, partial [Candidatus Limnocylindrales bacterium]
CGRDAGVVLVAVADALAAGRDPRTLGEDLIAALRDAFLVVMGAADEHVAPAQRERAARVGQRLGAAGLTRALDVLGESLVELARKPDPRIVVEVALVRLTQPATDRTLDAILDRLDRLERGSGPGGGGPSGGGSDAVGPSGGAAAAREALTSHRTDDAGQSPAPAVQAGDKPTLGAVVRQQQEGAGPPEPADRVTAPAGRIPDLDEITTVWTDLVLAGLPKSIRSRWRGGRWIEPDVQTSRFAVSNEWHQKACDESRVQVEEALLAHFGGPVPVAIVVEGETAAGSRASAPPPDDSEHIDPTELRDADDAVVTDVDLVVRTFGGGELIQED